MSARDPDDECSTASRYATRLLCALGVVGVDSRAPDEHPAVAAARCGLVALTGAADADPLICPAPLAAAADGALAALAALAPEAAFDDLRGADLLSERAAHFGHGRQGRRSAGGSCRLLDTCDGGIALNLAREDDWELLPALFEQDFAPDWDAVATAVQRLTMHDIVERGRLLGLAVTPVVPAPSQAEDLFFPLPHPGEGGPQGRERAAPQARNAGRAGAPVTPTLSPRLRGERGLSPRVLDLSSLWAGPLCGHLLQRCGADVVKLESTRRPDGARNGPPAFFDLMNAGKRSVALDLASDDGRRLLAALIARADIVIEASRPRALRQLGIDADAIVARQPGLTWISLTGYGRGEPQAQWIAYGDDAGVAGGLAYLMRCVHGEPMFVGDAIADPLAGLHAALAAWAGWRAGGAGLVSIALADVVRHVVRFEAPADAEGWRARGREWTARVAAGDVRAPRARAVTRAAAALGADNAAVFADWTLAC